VVRKQVKLRYQMRGLGIGMVITALVMGAATREGLPLSDAEIRARAMELGMVDSGNLSLKDVQGATPTPQPTPVPDTVSGNSGEQGEESRADSEVASEEGNLAGNRESEKERDPEGEPADSEAEEETADSDGEGETDDIHAGTASGEKVTVVMESGLTSSEICRRLAEAGLIADAAEFDSYLCSNGYSVKIRAGTYEISMGATEEEIIRIITKTR